MGLMRGFEGFGLTWYMVKLEHGPRINFKNMPEVNDNIPNKINLVIDVITIKISKYAGG